jgi:AcrR family transcriptional regulator
MNTRPKSDETRARILAAALDLFRKQGFEGATMREIASLAGVAVGAAYYYFESKDAIVLAFYDQAQSEMAPKLETILLSRMDLEQRLREILTVKLEYFAPSRRLLGALASHADPEHPLSPFSEQTKGIRESDIQVFERAISLSKIRIPEDLRPILPRLLWMYQMGLILFWIYDHSPSQQKTHRLIGKSLRLVVSLIKLSGFPLLRPLRRVVVDLADSVT